MIDIPLFSSLKLTLSRAGQMPAAGFNAAKCTTRTVLLVFSFAPALLVGCNDKKSVGGGQRTDSANQSDQSNQSNGHMGDDNQGTGTMHEGNGADNRDGQMMPQGQGRDNRYMDTMRHGMNDGSRGKTMMHRGMGKGHRMGM